MNKICKKLLKLIAIVFAANAALFAVFWFDLDGKLLFNVVEWWSPSSRTTTTTWSARTPSRLPTRSKSSPSTILTPD